MKKRFFTALAVVVLAMSSVVYADSVPKITKVPVTVITDAQCEFCSVDGVQDNIKSAFPQASFMHMDYRAKLAKTLIAKYKIKTLPVFLMPLDVKNIDGFSKIADDFSQNGDKFILKGDKTGTFLFLDRPYKDKAVTYFFDFYDYRTKDTFPVLREFCEANKIKLNINFVVPTIAVAGYPQQEITTALAVRNLYPDKFFDYLSERIKFIETLDCTTSVAKMSMDINALGKFLEPDEAGKLLKDNEVLMQEIGITNGNAILVNNVRLFMIMKAKKEDFAKIINHK